MSHISHQHIRMMHFQYIPHGNNRLATSIDLPEAHDHDEPGPLPLVIAIHGLTGNRLGHTYKFVELARKLNHNGIACLRFDQAGCAESTGRFQELTPRTMAEDTNTVMTWAASQNWYDPTRIAFVASSLGALPLFAADAGKNAAAAVLWAPVFDLTRTFKATTRTGLKAILDHQGWVPYHGLPLGKPFVDHLDAINTHQLLAEGNCPILIFHAPTDATVNFQESLDYQKRCLELGRTCTIIKMDNADHSFTDYRHRETLIDQTVQFLCNNLLDHTP